MKSQNATNINKIRQELESGRDPSMISAESMEAGEKAAWKEVLLKISPTLDADEKRADIIVFLQTIISQYFKGIQVFPYGSVPLKTYLADGDIDMTVICYPNMKDYIANDIYKLLKYEEQNMSAEYTIKETRMIGAEVKLVKCKVENIPIDISFNQLGGLSTLCFLEQVDHLVQKNHLFKRSVMLLKAWCHYECHILGAFHGLLATYALEVLILYIFQRFNSSLNGPLAVLYRFLDYYANFDWNNYCISLEGPILTSSLPNLVVTDQGNDGADLLLSKEDMRSYTEMFSSSTFCVNQDMQIFGAKYLNIMDPLKEKNNLGRSVSKANAARIISAFKYGARNLGRILQLPRESISDEIKKFFGSTLMNHGSSFAELERLSPLPVSEEDFPLESVEIDDIYDDGDDNDDCNDNNVEGTRPASNVSSLLKAWPLDKPMDTETVKESELLDLRGDYASSARNLAYSLCTLGYSSTIPALSTRPPTTGQFQEMPSTSAQWNLNENAAVARRRFNTGNNH
ncbi:uncharacterized protein LOC108194787 [Daucus carota subsp. sativus]|nr:PREDICTED: uncharacterized protein LOC108194787 [Daucus carota subsp. sativus]